MPYRVDKFRQSISQRELRPLPQFHDLERLARIATVSTTAVPICAPTFSALGAMTGPVGSYATGIKPRLPDPGIAPTNVDTCMAVKQ